MKKLIYIGTILLSSFVFQSVFGQHIVRVSFNDEIILTADEYTGDIQWQISNDNVNWTDIPGANEATYTAIITQVFTYYRTQITALETNCIPHHSESITLEVHETLLWSREDTWGDGGKPQEGDEVIIPENKHIILDENPPALGGLTIHGTLEFDNQDLELTSEWIMVHGTFRIGYEDALFQNEAIITLNDLDMEASQMNMGTRGIMVMGGNLELHGATPDVLWTKINEHAESGSTSLSLLENVAWQVDDEIIIAPTDYYEAGFGASITQRTSITNVNNNLIGLSEGLNAFRWGLLQYPTEGGMSLTPDNLVTPPVPDTSENTTPLVLDERAEVANISRNIVIQSPDDDLWNDEGFGVHTMIMPESVAHVEGVEFRRAGQRARARRYPFHWHMLSYSGTETLEDANGQYLRSSTVNISENRGIVIHGTNGVLVQNNIVYNVRGHGIFLEDAVERRNIIDGNLVMMVRNPNWGDELMQHEVGNGSGSSGFWISNPDNTITNNIVADAQTHGYWLAFPERAFGSSSEVLGESGLPIIPNRILFGVFDNNTAHSNQADGVHLDNPQIDDAGNTDPRPYWSSTDGITTGPPYDALRRFSLSRFKVWKHQSNGSWDRAILSDIYEVVSADNSGRFFAGFGIDGVIERSLVVGTSLNHLMNGTDRPPTADGQFGSNSSTPTAFATYHGDFSIRNNIVINFPISDDLTRSGVFASDDYYLRPIEKSHIKNSGNLIIQSHYGIKQEAFADYLTFASALWDPYGFWGPEDNYIVYDDPFLTHGKTITTIDPGADIIGGVSVEGPFYGFSGFVLNGIGSTPPQNLPYADFMAIHVRRLDPSDLSNEIATWDVTEANSAWALAHMRDFATVPEGIYELTFPGQASPPTDFQMHVENMLEATDTQVIGIEFDGTLPDPFVQIRRNNGWHINETYQQVGSLQEVRDSEGATWWRDTSNDRIWLKIRGGVWQPRDGDNFVDETYQQMVLRITYP
jgi:parallel beta-helix repeat protein